MTAKSYPADEQRVIDRYLSVRERLTGACALAGRSSEEVTLVGVSKTVAPSLIRAAVDAGLTDIGENYVQEYLSKRDALPKGITRHFIGHLQSNKVRAVVGEVEMIQSLDSVRLARAIDRVSGEKGVVTPVLAEVNIGAEESKSGVSREELVPLLEEVAQLSHIQVKGLMVIPPVEESEAKKREVFSQTRQLFIDISAKKIHNISMEILSMGMSDDFELAVAEGSTMVRVGTAIFGSRPSRARQSQ